MPCPSWACRADAAISQDSAPMVFRQDVAHGKGLCPSNASARRPRRPPAATRASEKPFAGRTPFCQNDQRHPSPARPQHGRNARGPRFADRAIVSNALRQSCSIVHEIKHWPFPVLPLEKRTEFHQQVVDFLDQAFNEQFRPYEFDGSNYGAGGSNGRIGELIHRGA